MIFWHLILAAILIAILANISDIYRYIRICLIYTKLPGPKFFPIMGSALKLAFVKEHEMMDFFEYFITGFKSASVFIFGRPYTVLRHPPDLERAMSSSEHITKGLEYNTIKIWLQEGLLTSTGSKWHGRRKVLTPTFHFKILEDNLAVMNYNATVLVNKFLSFDGKPTDVDKLVTLCSLDIISEAAMGIKLNTQDNRSVEYVRDIKRASYLIVLKEKTFWLRNNLFFHLSSCGRELNQVITRLQNFTNKVIADRRKTLMENDDDSLKEKKRMAFLDYLLLTEMKNPGTFTTSDIREEVDTFMFEGHDTTSSAIVFCLLLLSLNKDVQEKARDELEKIFGNSDRPARMEDLQGMKYLEMIIKETLRLYPSVPIMTRYLTKDLKLESGVVIPASTNLVIIPYLLHRDENLYEEPNKFMPERFSEENIKKRHPFSYIPFSAGPRNCIGQKFAMMEMKIILSTILRHSKMEPHTTIDSFKLLPLLILRPDSPVEIKFTPRILNKSTEEPYY